MTWAVVGASSGLGRAIAEELAARGESLLLVASDERDLEALAADLGIVHGAAIRTVAHDAVDHGGLAARVLQALEGEAVDGLLLPLGAVLDEDDGRLAPARAEEILAANLTAVVSVVSALLPQMLARGRGTIVGFSSVAATRGRGRNVVYAAAKRGLESFLESVRHVGEPRGLTVACYVLGYLDTNLAWGRRLPLPPADPRATARRVCRELGRVRGRRYHPRAWALAALALRTLPWFVYQRLRL